MPEYCYSVVPCGPLGGVVVTVRSRYAPDAGGYDAAAVEYAAKLGADATLIHSAASGRLQYYRLQKRGTEPLTIVIVGG